MPDSLPDSGHCHMSNTKIALNGYGIQNTMALKNEPDDSFGVIDIHTHIIPSQWPDWNKEFGYDGWLTISHMDPNSAALCQRGKCFRPIDDSCWSPQKRISDNTKTKVTMQGLSTIPAVGFNYWAKAEDALTVAKFLNDHIDKIVKGNPKNFFGLATIPLQDPSLAIKELDRCMHELNFVGVQIGTHVNEWNLDAKELEPFWKACEEWQVAVFVHPWDMLNTGRFEPYWFPWLIGMPCETTMAITSLMFGGVFDRHPKLKVCFAHGGGSFVPSFGRIRRGFFSRPEICQISSKTDPLELLKHVYVDSLVHDPLVLQLIVQTLGPNNIIVGSDYPFPLGETYPGSIVHLINIDVIEKDSNESAKETKLQDIKRLLLRDNALRFIERLPSALSKAKFDSDRSLSR